MKHDLERRIDALEARQPKQEPPNILSKLTIDELRRLGAIIERTEEWRLEPTAEEFAFLEELRDKYEPVQM